MAKNIKVVQESPTGRNQKFQDGPRVITRPEFIKEIRQGEQPGYHERKVNGVPTPVSNPDRSKKNNLG